MKKKIYLSEQVSKDLTQLADFAERYVGARLFAPIWDRLNKAVEDEPDPIPLTPEVVPS